ncbi:hypothetical protein GCM10009696_06320 [Kocuria himachalensis]
MSLETKAAAIRAQDLWWDIAVGLGHLTIGWLSPKVSAEPHPSVAWAVANSHREESSSARGLRPSRPDPARAPVRQSPSGAGAAEGGVDGEPP